MKTGDMKPGMAVYYSGSAYDIKHFRENPDDCRWVTDGKRYYRSLGYRGDWREATGRVRGTHVKLTREVPAQPPYYMEPRTLTAFVVPSKVLGEYESVAAERRELIAKANAERDTERQRRETAEARKARVAARAVDLGYQLSSLYGDRGAVQMDVETLERLLDDLEQLSRLSRPAEGLRADG